MTVLFPDVRDGADGHVNVKVAPRRISASSIFSSTFGGLAPSNLTVTTEQRRVFGVVQHPQIPRTSIRQDGGA